MCLFQFLQHEYIYYSMQILEFERKHIAYLVFLLLFTLLTMIQSYWADGENNWVHEAYELILLCLIGLTHCILVDSSTDICWMSPFVSLGVLGLFLTFILFLMENPVYSKQCRPSDQKPHYMAPDLDLHCLPMTLFQVSRYRNNLKYWDR